MAEPRPFAGALRRRRGRFQDIRARNETLLAGTGQDQATDGVIIANAGRLIDQVVQQLRGQGVHRRSINADRRNALGRRDSSEFRAHGRATRKTARTFPRPPSIA